MDSTIYNNPVQTIKDYSEITDTYVPFVDLGTDYIYRALLISSSLDQPVTIRFYNPEQFDPELTILPGKEIGLDNFRHNDEIEIKYPGTAPSSGKIEFISWRAE